MCMKLIFGSCSYSCVSNCWKTLSINSISICCHPHGVAVISIIKNVELSSLILAVKQTNMHMKWWKNALVDVSIASLNTKKVLYIQLCKSTRVTSTTFLVVSVESVWPLSNEWDQLGFLKSIVDVINQYKFSEDLFVHIPGISTLTIQPRNPPADV